MRFGADGIVLLLYWTQSLGCASVLVQTSATDSNTWRYGGLQHEPPELWDSLFPQGLHTCMFIFHCHQVGACPQARDDHHKSKGLWYIWPPI